jgi:dTDP-glucose 4,6-dehydratase
VVVTGGAGFIGSHFTRRLLAQRPDLDVTVLDKLTYAGNLANLTDLAGNQRYHFIEGDIADSQLVDDLAGTSDAFVNFAAESHVDRSIEAAVAFAETGVVGTTTLLEAARRHGHKLFLQVGTDEVYGNRPSGSSEEQDPLRPRSPYSAAKAGADLMVLAYRDTYGLPVVVTRSSNNFGPFQYPEKIVSLFITNALDGQPLPIYGDGLQVRDWIYVEDNCAAIEQALFRGVEGTVYNIGGGHELTNLDLTRAILDEVGQPLSLMQLVEDRAGHDRRYSAETSRIRRLGWAPRHKFRDALRETVAWYRDNRTWWEPLKSGAYREYYERQYAQRLAAARPAE